MLLNQIISALENQNNSVLIEKMIPYKKSLRAYYKAKFGGFYEPILMVTSVSNSAQYGRIVSADAFHEEIEEYLSSTGLTAEEKSMEFELINFNSILLNQL